MLLIILCNKFFLIQLKEIALKFDELFLEKRNDLLTKYEDYLDKIPYQRHQKRKKGLLK